MANVEETEVEKLRRENLELRQRLEENEEVNRRLREKESEMRIRRLEMRVSHPFANGISIKEKIKQLKEELGRAMEENINNCIELKLINDEVDLEEETERAEQSNVFIRFKTSLNKESGRVSPDRQPVQDNEEIVEDNTVDVSEGNDDQEQQNEEVQVDDLEVTASTSPAPHNEAPMSPRLRPRHRSQPQSSSKSSSQPTPRKAQRQQTRRKSTRKPQPENFVKRTLPLPHPTPTERSQYKYTNNGRVSRQRHAMDKGMLRYGWYCICSASFKEQGRLTEHIKYFTCEPKFPCTKCVKRYTSLTLLRDHLRTCHKEDPYPAGVRGCGDCGIVFANHEEHKAHRLANHPRWSERIKILRHAIDHTVAELGRFRCLCSREFGNMMNLRAHVRGYNNPARFQCKHCISRFSSLAGLNAHLRNIHKETTHETVTTRQAPSYGCNQCGRVVQSKKELQQHLHRQHGIISWYQPDKLEMDDPASRPQEHGFAKAKGSSSIVRCLCGSGYPTKRQLQAHIKKAQRQGRPRVPFKCPYCPVDFHQHTRLARHIRLIHKVTDYKAYGCTLCGTCWPSRVALRRHQDDQGHRGS